MFQKVIKLAAPSLAFAVTCSFCLSSSSHALESASSKELKARKFVELISQQRASLASDLMDVRLKDALPPHVLESLWQSLVQDNGSFDSFSDARFETSRLAGTSRVVISSKFKNDDVDFVVSVNGDGKVSNIVVRPHPDFVDPGYGKKDSFSELPVDFVSGKFTLGATLCLPQGKGPFPAVVLVHLSGPHDRDETVGAIKVFRDIAWGLASNGVAVLRYEKRSSQYPDERLATVNDETVDDAVAAAKSLMHRQEIDHKRVFLLGHSLGAVMVPRIAERVPELAGFMICAAPTQALEDVILSQIEFVEKVSGAGTDSSEVDTARHDVKIVKQLSSDPQTLKGAPLLGLERTWWLDMKNYDHVQSAKKISKPVFLIHGEKDYQVDLKEYEIWKSALADRSNFTLKSYPNLSHVFAKAGEVPGPTDYLTPLNVSGDVILDLANWVKAPGKLN